MSEESSKEGSVASIAINEENVPLQTLVSPQRVTARQTEDDEIEVLSVYPESTALTTYPISAAFAPTATPAVPTKTLSVRCSNALSDVCRLVDRQGADPIARIRMCEENFTGGLLRDAIMGVARGEPIFWPMLMIDNHITPSRMQECEGCLTPHAWTRLFPMDESEIA